MAKKIGTATYQVSPAETLTILVSGPFDPGVVLDDQVLPVKAGKAFPITPKLMSSGGIDHVLDFTLAFPPGDPLARYSIAVSDATTTIDTFTVARPDRGETARVEAEILQVARLKKA